MAEKISFRKHTIDALTPLLPKRWTLQDHGGLPDTIVQPTVVLNLKSYARGAVASWRIATFILTVIEPKTAPGAADDSLDDDVINLLNAIDELGHDAPIIWTTADRAVAGNFPAFDINLQISIQIEQETT